MHRPHSVLIDRRWVIGGSSVDAAHNAECSDRVVDCSSGLIKGDFCFMNGLPANTRRLPNAGLMLAHRLRRWANISPALDERVVLAGLLALHPIQCE